MNLKMPKFWLIKKVSFLSILFYPISLIFYLTRFISKLKIAKKYPIKIICVGNIFIGGTGKTPLSAEIFKITKSLGKKPAFVKKYYDYIRDEINFLSAVGKTFSLKSRHESIKRSIEDKHDLLILDDGLQDHSIKKDFSIVCFNQKQWVGNGFLIPSGPLRDKLSVISQADCIFINGNKDEKIEKEVYKYDIDAKIYYSEYIPININSFKNKKIIAFAGIGNPNSFFDILEDHKLDVLEKISFPDHYYYKSSDINSLMTKSKESESILLTTEKDYLRLKQEYKNNINFLKIKLDIKNLNSFLDLIKKKI